MVEIVWSLDDNYKSQLFESKVVLKKNLDALVRFRNAISHNRTLINYRDFKEVTLTNGEIGCSLLINIKNLLNLLPSPIKDSYREEINGASKTGVRKTINQVEWWLGSYLIIRI